MNIKFLNVALGVALAATSMSASAQKSYTSGTITMSGEARGQAVEMKDYFTPDSTALAFSAGPANIKVLRTNKMTYLAVILDVPVASMKKAAIANPDEIDQMAAQIPKFTYAPGTETKTISGFNCKKVVATDTKTNKTYDVWITNDVTLPAGVGAEYYQGIGGIPIQYTAFQQGQESSVTVTSITDAKAPAGTFAISADFDKITMDDLKAMSGGGN
jgi:GLPGLI family protein